MNTIPRAGWVLVLLLCTTNWLSAQKSTLNEDLVKADRQFALYAYNLAMQTYQQVLKDDSRNAHALARVGDCYFQLNNPAKSLEWYQKAIRQYNMEPDVHLRYGKALMQTGDYEGAKEQFLTYSETDETVGSHYANVCEYAIKNSTKESAWSVKNEALNTEFADFCPTFIGSRVAYNSARTDVIAKTKATDSPSGSQNYLLVTQQNPESGLLQKPQVLRSELQNARNEGPASFSADGHRVAFCRNNFMYTADVDENGKWKNIKAFPYNGSSYATGFPALSPDGGTLVFSSTQPGGFGGWDIYVSNYNDGAWSTPRNLGAPLNTVGDEVTPYYDGEFLYFSSDWHRGFGGLDVFKAELGREQVSEVLHLGAGVNSERDDYGFIYSSDDNVGYVTSTRPGGRGNEDIWKLSKKWNDEVATTGTRKNSTSDRPVEHNNDEEALIHHVLITDENDKPISGAEIDLSDCYGDKGYTDKSGKFTFDELNKSIECQVVIKKIGYRDTEISLTNFGKKNIKIALQVETREQFSGRVYDARSKAPVRGVTVSIEQQDGNKMVETQTDEDGKYALFLEPDNSYVLNYSKYGYVSQISKSFLGMDSGKIPSTFIEKEDSDEGDGYEEYSTTSKPVEHSSDEYDTPVLRKKPTDDVEKGAEKPTLRGYSIQLAATPEEPSDAKLRSYEPLTNDGNIYVKAEKKLHKIRLGIFKTKEEADVVFKKLVASKSTKDAFIVEETNAQADLFVGGIAEAPMKPSEYDLVEQTTTKSSKKPGVLYALQLGSFASEKAIVVSNYANLRGLGNLYSNTENENTQVRLGIWDNHEKAEAAKEEAINRGFPKAIIVTEKADDPDIQEFILDSENPTAKKNAKMHSEKGENAPKPQVYSNEEETALNPYFIRIAALSNPDRFDSKSLEDLGSITKRKAENSPGMTVILLSGFETLADAEAALVKVQRRGYSEAYVMKEINGTLRRQ
jgi:hypothetical protein